MAAEAKDDGYVNNVAEGIRETERILTEKGVTPADARRMSSYRVFGGVNGNYGTGIQGMVTASDRWTSSSEIAQVYMNNMGAYYGSEEGWQRGGLGGICPVRLRGRAFPYRRGGAAPSEQYLGCLEPGPCV